MSRIRPTYKDCAPVYMYMSAQKQQRKRVERAPEDAVVPENEFDNSTSADNITENAIFLFYDEHFAIAFKKITLQTIYDSGDVVDEELRVLNVQTGPADALKNFDVNMPLHNGQEISFQMIHAGSNAYAINEMSYDNSSFKISPMESAIEVPGFFSYFCADLKLRKSAEDQPDEGVNSKALLWENLQFQHTVEHVHAHTHNATAGFDEDYDYDDEEDDNGIKSNISFKFYDAWNCVGVFTAGSLMGTLGLLITAVGVGVGLFALLSIDSPPRFEDPRVPAFEGGT